MTEAIYPIAAIGDSLTEPSPHCWPIQLQRLDARLRLHNNAHGGWTTRSFFRPHLFPLAFPDLPPETALGILLLGTNDMFEAGGGSEAAVREACDGIGRLVDHLRERAPQSRVLLLTPPRLCLSKADWSRETGPRRLSRDTPEFLLRLGEAYADLAVRRKWGFLDLQPVLEEADFLDAAHPDAKGHGKLAEAIHPAALEQLGLALPMPSALPPFAKI